MDDCEDYKPSDALTPKAIGVVYELAFVVWIGSAGADPVERLGENDSISCANLPESRHEHVKHCEEILVHQVPPIEQDLILCDFNDQDAGRHNQ